MTAAKFGLTVVRLADSGAVAVVTGLINVPISPLRAGSDSTSRATPRATRS